MEELLYLKVMAHSMHGKWGSLHTTMSGGCRVEAHKYRRRIHAGPINKEKNRLEEFVHACDVHVTHSYEMGTEMLCAGAKGQLGE
jgi:hypothetical protein